MAPIMHGPCDERTPHHTLDRYRIRGVMGPDEYHGGYLGREEPGLDDNAYTNVMTVWGLRRALEVLVPLTEQRRRELEEVTGMPPHEVDLFEDVSRRMRVPFHDGATSRFEGYADLEEPDWDRYRAAYGNIRRLDRILEAQAGALRLSPGLPAGTDRLSFRLRCRGHWNIRSEVTADRVRVGVPCSDAPPIRVEAAGREATVEPGSSVEPPC